MRSIKLIIPPNKKKIGQIIISNITHRKPVKHPPSNAVSTASVNDGDEPIRYFTLGLLSTSNLGFGSPAFSRFFSMAPTKPYNSSSLTTSPHSLSIDTRKLFTTRRATISLMSLIGRVPLCNLNHDLLVTKSVSSDT